MENKNLYPKAFFDYFDDISKIPRGSGNEKGIASYLIEFAKKNGLEYYTDEHYNVLIKKPASEGCEALPKVALQGHTDMVCQKTADSEHDFTTDPINWYVDGEYIKAQSTTLGADDGAAVCLMLCFLSDETLIHPALSCLFTSCEETGLYGAKGFDYSKLDSDYLINIDSEEEYDIITSCAGGIKLYLTKQCEVFASSNDFLKITIDGLHGGHSGTDIDKGRMNSNAKLISLLGYLVSNFGIQLAEFHGGSVDNAITPSSYCVIGTERSAEVIAFCSKFEKVLKNIAVEEDRQVKVTCEKHVAILSLSSADTKTSVEGLKKLKSGVAAMSADIKGLVQTSANIGIVDLSDGCFSVHISTRSSVEKEKLFLCEFNEKAAQKGGFDTERTQEYPGWEFKKDSPLRELYIKCFKQTNDGKEPTISAIHAGLECGIISRHLPNLDIISIGPDMENVHSPTERLNIASVGRIYDTIKLLLRSMKEEMQ